MLGWPFRFVHASDFHLELPLFGVTAVPPHLREIFLEAPYEAARRVFDTVLAEEAEFLVLSGDLLNPLDAGPRGVFFLLEQFQRLAERRIPVYWAAGRVDSAEGWPSSATLPENVQLFPRGRSLEKIYQRESQPLARLIGASRHQRSKLRSADFFVEPGDLFSIAVAHGHLDDESLLDQGIGYWALGGEHQRKMIDSAPHAACYCGSPQGREPAESGAHGCLLVHVEDRRTVRMSLVETDTVRWCDEQLSFDEGTQRGDLAQRMHNRLSALRAASPHASLLVSWTLAGSGPLLAALRHGGLVEKLLAELRADLGHEEPVAWSIDIAVEPATALPPAWYDEDTILGEFLRRMRSLEEHPEERIDLQRFLSERHVAGSLSAMVDLGSPEVRQRALRRATLLGTELLRGDAAASAAQSGSP